MPRYKELMTIKGVRARRKVSSSYKVSEVAAEAYAFNATDTMERILESLSAQDLSEPAACCRSNQERNKRYLDGELTLQDIMEIVDHLKECKECVRQREVEGAIRAVVKRCCSQEQAPESLKTRIIIRINMMAGQ